MRADSGEMCGRVKYPLDARIDVTMCDEKFFREFVALQLCFGDD